MWSRIIYLLIALCPLSINAQQKFVIEQGTIRFTSNAELELIQAASDKVQGLLDDSNKFAFFVEIQSFKGFNSQLQREHFNEKYLESERYTKATFVGKIIEEIDLTKSATYEVRAKGDLDIHGVKQARIIKSKITVSGNKISIESRFFVPLLDHNISIPQIVNRKIATEIEIAFTATLIPKK